MFAIPFLSPALCGILAYRATACDRVQSYYDDTLVNVPVQIQRILACFRTPRSRCQEGVVPEHPISSELSSFLDRARIRKDLRIIEHLNLSGAVATGTNFCTKGDATIWLAPGLYELDKDACHWVMKHEVSHIKHNDTLTRLAIPTICSAAAALCASLSEMSVSAATCVTIAVQFATFSIFAKYRECKADDFANAESSIEELKGGRRFFISMQNCAHGGERWCNFSHPSLANRIAKIERALEQRDARIDLAAEQIKIESLTALWTRLSQGIGSREQMPPSPI